MGAEHIFYHGPLAAADRNPFVNTTQNHLPDNVGFPLAGGAFNTNDGILRNQAVAVDTAEATG